MFLKKIKASMVIAISMLFFGTGAQAALITLPSSGIGSWSFGGPGTLVDLSGAGDFSHSFSLAAPTTVSFVADDCCIPGDAFGLILDSAVTPWTMMDTTGSSFGPGLFHGVHTAMLAAGAHMFSLEVTADCCGSGGMGWSVSAVPEPETYAMLLVGLGLVGWMARRRKSDVSFQAFA